MFENGGSAVCVFIYGGDKVEAGRNMDGSLMNCKKCGRLFQAKDELGLCSRCNANVDDEFTKVKDYIYDNPSSSLKDVAEGTDVPTESILKWIREGKIILSSDSGIRFCQKCGASIISGKFCNSCVAHLQSNLKVDAPEPEKKEYRGMHTKG